MRALLTLNTSTGAGTVVGALGTGVFDIGLAFDAAGNLYLTSDNNGGSDFYSINPVTGVATLIGATGTSGVVGLDFSAGGILYGLVDTPDNNLVTIDTATGLATVIGGLGTTTNTGALGFDGGSLYGAFGIVNEGLYTIDPATGAATAQANPGVDFAGLAMRQQQVPEPGTLALSVIGLFSLLGASRRFKKG